MSATAHPSRKNVYFLTENEEIKSALLHIGIKEKKSQSISRTEKEFIANWIRNTDKNNKKKNVRNLCRDSEMYEYLLTNLYNPDNPAQNHKYTSLFISGGDKILGLVNFYIFTMANGQKIMQTKGICVPDYGARGSGRLLIDILKELGELLHVDKLVIFSLKDAKMFYIKNGLVEEVIEEMAEEDKVLHQMIYDFQKLPENTATSEHSPIKSKAGAYKTRKTRKNKNRKTRHRKTYKNT
jgi:hypothetical protein